MNNTCTDVEAFKVFNQLSPEDKLKSYMQMLIYGQCFVEKTETGYRLLETKLVDNWNEVD